MGVCHVLTRRLGALKQHPGPSGPALQMMWMSSPGTARLAPHYHSPPSCSLLTASPYSSPVTSHARKSSCTPHSSFRLRMTIRASGCLSSISLSLSFSHTDTSSSISSDSSGFLFEGMLTRNRRGSPPAFLLWLHRLLVRPAPCDGNRCQGRDSSVSGLP